MATLVLSTIGTALGGPIAGAIGALVGQSFDQQLLAPAQRGPRLGDLSVQTSSYGSQVPRIFGRMRVAGSVVWATDLTESEQTAGAKGQPDVVYSYSVSLAVALSSRPVSAIGRIWADGKLLRGAEGDFKVSTHFRFYNGGEDQLVDPLIGSIEGLGNTPAYRGIALAVFEDLELAEFGNRIPFLTFEVIADDEPPRLDAVLADASAGAIAAEAADAIVGYAAYGPSVRAAVEPLVETYAVELFDDGTILRPAATSALAIGDEEFGNSADGHKQSRSEREQVPTRRLPAVMRMSYYDPSRDYQAGEARAAVGEAAGAEAQREIPAVLDATDAKSLAENVLARAWAHRDRLRLRLPPGRLALEPGSKVQLRMTPSDWTVEQCTVDGLVIVADLRPTIGGQSLLRAEAGRIVANPDIVAGAATVALLDIPDVTGQSASEPTLLLASTSSSGWRPSLVHVARGAQTGVWETARRKSLLGRALTQLSANPCDLLDLNNVVEVELVDAEQWLTSCDDEALAAGSNIAVIGREVVQFARVEPIGPGRFRLSRLLRGRAATEWAVAQHTADETFCVIASDTLRRLELPSATIGSQVSAAIGSGPAAHAQVSGESIRPPAPVKLTAALQPNGDLQIAWVRRSRQGWAWIDEVDAPLGEARERYQVLVAGPGGSGEFASSVPSVAVPAASLDAIGSGPVLIEVRQIGDWAASRPEQMTILLP